MTSKQTPVSRELPAVQVEKKNALIHSFPKKQKKKKKKKSLL
jgi:hypothetical protein